MKSTKGRGQYTQDASVEGEMVEGEAMKRSTNLKIDGQVEEIVSSFEVLINRFKQHFLVILVGNVLVIELVNCFNNKTANK